MWKNGYSDCLRRTSVLSREIKQSRYLGINNDTAISWGNKKINRYLGEIKSSSHTHRYILTHTYTNKFIQHKHTLKHTYNRHTYHTHSFHSVKAYWPHIHLHRPTHAKNTYHNRTDHTHIYHKHTVSIHTTHKWIHFPLITDKLLQHSRSIHLHMSQAQLPRAYWSTHTHRLTTHIFNISWSKYYML